MLLSFLGLLIQANMVTSRPWSDCHGIAPFEEEAESVANYTSKYYDAFYFENWPKSDIIEGSLPVADIWYFSGHGGKNWYGKPYLIAGDNKKIYGDDIPYLRYQHEFYEMRFAYASACYSAHTSFWPWVKNLHDGFMEQGAQSYMGWKKSVYYSTSYTFTNRFYDYAINEMMDVETAKYFAEQDVPAADGNIRIFVESGQTVHLIPWWG